MITLTRYGIREWGVALLLAIAASTALGYFGWWWALLPIWLAWLAVAAFFRNPRRAFDSNLGSDVMLSPADGVVTLVERVDRHEATGNAPALIVRIFLSVLDVHLNYAPCDATVVKCVHRPGRYLDARTVESAQVNESNLIVLQRGSERIGVRQVSGAIARRIVCPLAPGQVLRRGQVFGMIKFGSTTELILPRPDQAQPLVKRGDRVKGGLTPVATLPV